MKFARTILALSLTVLAMPILADQDIAGSYKCTGYDPEGRNSYDTDLTITKTGDTFHFKWQEGESSYSGTGIFSRSAKDVVAAEFWNPKNQNQSGVIVYQAKADGSIDGHWAYADKVTVGTETCKKS